MAPLAVDCLLARPTRPLELVQRLDLAAGLALEGDLPERALLAPFADDDDFGKVADRVDELFSVLRKIDG